MNNAVTFRFATKDDVATILEFINLLAVYENMQDDVVATEELLTEWIFDKKKAEVLFAVVDGNEVGMALFFNNFSTFLGKAGLYLEDLFVKEEFRGKGYGKALLNKIAQITVERDLGRFEWVCLDWNNPSIEFYLSVGAKHIDGWNIYRLTGADLNDFAKK